MRTRPKMVRFSLFGHDSESLDRCIQTALSALYPPFQATSPTVLCQVLSVVERCYRGDGLRYLLHFLLPAKQFLQNLQQDACLPYCGLLFRHEGWPLCLHEKVVIQLCHLDQRLLRPGDFYLLVSPSSAPPSRHRTSHHGLPPTPRLLLCSVSTGSRHVEEQEIPEPALSSLFNMAWLDSVNRDREQRGASRMERCLLSAHGDVFRVPWEDLVYPQFISRPRASLKDVKEASVNNGTMHINRQDSKDGTISGSKEHSVRQDTTLPCPVKQSVPSSDESDSEGEYVELTELPLPRFSPQKGSLTQLISQQHKARTTSTQTMDQTGHVTQTTPSQSTQNHSEAASKDAASSSSSTEPTGQSEIVYGRVVLTRFAQATAFCENAGMSDDRAGITKCKDLELRSSTPQDEKKEIESFQNMDVMIVQGEVVNVVTEEREDGEGVEEEVEMVGDTEVELEADIQMIDENHCEKEEQESGTDLSLTRQEARVENVQQILSENFDAHFKVGTQEIQLEETNLQNTEIPNLEIPVNIDVINAHVENLETSNLVPKHFKTLEAEKIHSKYAGEKSENLEVSLDAYIEKVTKEISDELQTCIIYLEATNSENFRLSDSHEDVNTKEDSQTRLQNISAAGKIEAKLNEGLDLSSLDMQCERQAPIQDLDLHCFYVNPQSTPVKKPDTECTLAKDVDGHGDALLDSKQTRCKEIESQNILSNMKKGEKTKQNEQVNTQSAQCEELLGMEIVQDTKCGRDLDRTTEMHRPQDEETEIHLYKVKQMFPEKIVIPDIQPDSTLFETSTKQDSDELEIENILSEMVDTVEDKVSQEIFDGTLDKKDHMLVEEIPNAESCQGSKVNIPIERPNKTTIETATPDSEISEPQEASVSNMATPKTFFEEDIVQQNTQSSTVFTHVKNVNMEMHEDLKQEGNNEPRKSQEPQVEMESRHCVELLPNVETKVQIDKRLSEKSIETVEDMNISNNQESGKRNTQKALTEITYNESSQTDNHVRHVDLYPIQAVHTVGINTPSVSTPLPNTQSQQTEKVEAEHISCNFTNVSPKNCQLTRQEETKGELVEMGKPVCLDSEAKMENGPQNGCKHEGSRGVAQLPHVNSDLATKQQPETPKVQETNSQETDNGPKERIGETKQLMNGQIHDGVPTEGSNSVHPGVNQPNGLIPKASPPPPVSLHVNQYTPVRLSQSSQSRFTRVLLSAGVLCLPGTRDRSGRALLTVCCRNPVWSNPDCDRAELLHLLLYFISTLRKEVRALGLTVLVDVRRAPPASALFTALRSLQDNTPGSIHIVLLLINRDSPVRLEKPPSLQVEMLYSMKSLQKHLDLRQLPTEFGGSFNFSQSSWLCYRTRVENLTNQCNNVISLLQKTIHILESTPLPSDAESAEQLLSKYKAVMCSILQDSRLVQLQQEGGASLSWLRRDESSISATEDYRAAVEEVSSLYDQVDELLHRLVTLSNSRTQELQFILEFTGLETGFKEVRTWMEEVGEVRLKSFDESEDSLELLIKNQKDFKDFCTTACDWCQRGQALLKRLEQWENVSSSDLQAYETKVHSFWAELQDFSQRVNTTGKNIERAVRLYRFLDQGYGWALEGMRHLAGVTMEDCTLPDKCQSVISCLEDYNRHHPPIADGHFQEMRALAGELRGERGLRQWSFAWAKCQETKKMFDRKMEAALRTRDSTQRRRSDSEHSRSSFSRKSLSGLWGSKEPPQMPSNQSEDSNGSCSPSTPSPPRNSTPSPVTSTPLLQRLFRSPSSDDPKTPTNIPPSPAPSLQRLDSSSSFTSSCTSSSICSSYTPLSRRQQLRKTQSFDCPPTPESSRYGASPRTLSEPARRGNTGVFIKGLEVTSTEAADRTLCPRTGAQGWAGQGMRSPSTPSIHRSSESISSEQRPRGSKLRHIVEEMVNTEREYVRSLRYIIDHYFPEMDRPDVPQDLRGKRSVVFGNLEKLLDFHSQYFLKELEACWKHPLRVPHCFLRHQEQFSLYALYSKNKPKSDTLLANHGNSFFRRKQVELGDKMDLSSYLLKPIQRMSKYALLLSDLMKEVGVSQEAELATLHAATNMVKFQLRHGNDLLAMDAIRDCDVNLKEQGQLIRQDEFTVWSGRRKCQRHVFLFEDMVLFSKPKRMEGGLDVFIYKHSFKTADVGLTESTGDDGLRFEIWFRRRTSKNQTFMLQASSSEVKQAWTQDIARLLWNQANRNKEMRLKEMVSMGVGNKPFLDIQPSDAAISDRAVHYIMKSRGARTRASIAVSVFDHSNPFKRSVTSNPPPSGPSSSSLLGPLNLHMFSQVLPSPGAAEGSFITSCIEEDEQEHETSSQPSMTTESSGSSSRCLSGSTGSDSGCVSSHLQEALQEEPNPSQPSSSSSSSSFTNKQHLNNQYISANGGPVISPATIV